MTDHGKVQYFDDGLDAARQAGLDLAVSMPTKPASTEADDGPQTDWAGWVSAIAGVVSALGTVGNFAVNLANLVNTGDKESGGTGASVEIRIENQSSTSVVLYAYEPNSADVSNVPDPMGPGESDVMVLTRPGETFTKNESGIDMTFAVGEGNDVIPVLVRYVYTDVGTPGRWKVRASVDDLCDDPHSFPVALQLMGASFESTCEGYPSFSFYTAPIESGSGSLSLRFLDRG